MKDQDRLKQIAIDIVTRIQSVILNRDIINQRLEEGRAWGFSDIEIGDAIRRESRASYPTEQSDTIYPILPSIQKR